MPFEVKHLGLVNYESTCQSMQAYTQQRDENTPDQIWFLEHPAVFTLGYAGDPSHILNPGSIPIVKTDRGGQVTYHGPGQLIVYTLIDLKRRKIGIKQWVKHLEQSTVSLLKEFNIPASTRCNAPGVYVNDAKICSIGLRVRHGCTYHGLALNVNMDLEPFSRINPCGMSNLAMTQLADFGVPLSVHEVSERLMKYLREHLA
ncbi:MAG: lipoyl(octanoyl) transferase LipB [Proteobacteria bacterium]|nr:lipoyl(octanoyl) transferase LipB [Pseudomonadota bacterium]